MLTRYSIYIGCRYTFCEYRLFTHPNPSKRAILDSVSNLIDAVNRSLRMGIIRSTTFTTEFRTDVFKYLFT